MVLRRRPFTLRGSRLLALSWLLLLLLVALLPLAGFGPSPRLNLMQLNQPPSTAHWLGTDPFGRDVLSDLLAGTRSLLTLSVPGALLTSLVGSAVGIAAGYWGNHGLMVRQTSWWALGLSVLGALLTSPALIFWWLLGGGVAAYLAIRLPPFVSTVALPLDRLTLSATTFLSAVPRLVLVIGLAAVQEPSRPWLLLVLGISCWPATANLARVLVQQQRRQLYVEAGHVAGYSDQHLLLRHILPNIWPSLRAVVPLNLSICLGLQTTLTFLGIGLPPDEPDWGRTLANARLEPGAWWLTLSALSVLTLTIISLRHLLPHPSGSRPSEHATDY